VNKAIRNGLGATIVQCDDDPGSVAAAGTATLRADLHPLPGLPPPGNPLYAKVFAALIVGYVFSPIDPIPDFIPGVGLLDEMLVVPLGVLLAAKMIPRDVFEECREKAREVAEGGKPVSRVAAVVVFCVWLVCVALAVFLALWVF
jgi:uncharacterized membrane protein YkvA (DUF1232 family)